MMLLVLSLIHSLSSFHSRRHTPTRARAPPSVYPHRCLSCLVSKENDLDSNASSIDTDMEDNLSQDNQSYSHLVSATPTANSVLIVPRTLDDELNDVSLNENDHYLTANLPDIRLLHPSVNTDPNLNHHNRTIVDSNHMSTDLNSYPHEHVLQYYANTAGDRSKLVKSESIPTPSASAQPPADASYDPNSDMTFLYDLVTPPAAGVHRRLLHPQSNPHVTNLFEDGWNG